MSVINTNTAANSALRNLLIAQKDPASSSENLSSDLRINRAADDAGITISEGLHSQVNGLGQSSRDAQNGMNMLQPAEGGLAEAHSILQRVRMLTVHAGDESNNASSRTAINAGIDMLGDELIGMSGSINFNGIKLNDGASSGPFGDGNVTFQVGSGSAGTEQISVDLTGADLGAIGAAVKLLTVDTAANALAPIAVADTQIGAGSTVRSTIDAAQNRLETTMKHVNVSEENLSAVDRGQSGTELPRRRGSERTGPMTMTSAGPGTQRAKRRCRSRWPNGISPPRTRGP